MIKRITALALTVLLALSLCACGARQEEAFSADLAAFYETLYQGDDAPMMMPLEDEEMLDYVYPGLSDIELKQSVIYTAAISAVAAECTMVEVADAGDVDAVKSIFEERIRTQVGDDETPGGAWYPETIEQWEKNSEIVVKGSYVCLFVGENKDDMVAAFNALGESK